MNNKKIGVGFSNLAIFFYHTFLCDKKIVKALLIFAIAGLIITSSGCMGPESEVEEIKSGVVESQGKIETYKMDADMELIMGANSMAMTITAKLKSLVDLRNHKMKTDMDMTMSMMGSSKMEIYLIEDTLYRDMDMKNEWTQTKLDELKKEEMWNERNQIKKEFEMFEKSELELSGSEEIRGTDCWVIKVKPDTKALKEYVQSGLSQSSTDLNDAELPDMEFKNVTIKYWISKDDHFIKKEANEIEFTMIVTSGKDVQSIDMKMKTIIEIYDYNLPVEINLPGAAANARIENF
ncbi:MAG: hypothetical protein CVT90_00955 [Candidatus Altiarchaeales archaeon HGW-Altiarchaeales-3]|nr:MAG: hypothetical protein CVT90_00955 [Candidatus Altiarchaeales archaeon HGW-Altiarchaeales-3]